MLVELDPAAGFCFGVDASIALAEKHLQQGGKLYCLGELVHNEEETLRLTDLGMVVIDYQHFSTLKNATVLLRAHGEPPSTYDVASKNNLTLIDGTCPIVKSLQHKVSCSYEDISGEGGQVVVFGSKNHPEVVGLNGQTNDHAIVVVTESDLESIDFTRKIHLFAQTTRSVADYQRLQNTIKERISVKGGDPKVLLNVVQSICKQVSNRVPQLQNFALAHEVMVFVAGKSSSNGKVLFGAAQSVNPRTFFASDVSEIQPSWFQGVGSVGISGATSTPKWLMENIAGFIKQLD